MEFSLSEDQRLIRDAAREFASREIAPRAAAYDRTGEFPWDNVKQLGAQGYLGMLIPEEYGGAGMDMVSHTIVVEEIGRACAATAVILEVHNLLHSELLNRWGSEDLKGRYLPLLASGEKLGAFALTEPQAGSDAANQRTTAVRHGGHYVLDGRKSFITNGGQADLYVVFARTDPDRGSKGISAFMVEKGWAGLGFGRPEEKLGIHASHTTEVILEGVRVPVGNLIGQEGDGYKIALSALDAGRTGIAAQAVGVCQAALDASLDYARQREQFGRPIAEFQAIQWKLAAMATDLEAARWLTYRAAWLYDQGGRHTMEIAQAKLFASEMAMRHAVEAVQIHGGYGYMREYGVERLMRDIKITQIYEGTSEVMKLIIAGHLLR